MGVGPSREDDFRYQSCECHGILLKDLTGFHKLKSSEGATLEAEFVNGKVHSGTWISPENERYEGTFLDGRFHGKGKFAWKDGRTFEGSFDRDCPVQGTQWFGASPPYEIMHDGVTPFFRLTPASGRKVSPVRDTSKDPQLVSEGSASPSHSMHGAWATEHSETAEADHDEKFTSLEPKVKVGEIPVHNKELSSHPLVPRIRGLEAAFVSFDQPGLDLAPLNDAPETETTVRGRNSGGRKLSFKYTTEERSEDNPQDVGQAHLADGVHRGTGVEVERSDDASPPIVGVPFGPPETASENRCRCHGLPQVALHGQHRVESGSGWTYDGEWREGMRDGRGIWVSDKQGSYEGAWRRNQMHGSGSFTWASGVLFRGSFEEGCPVQGELVGGEGLGIETVASVDSRTFVLSPALRLVPAGSGARLQAEGIEAAPASQLTWLESGSALTNGSRCACHGEPAATLQGWHTVSESDGRKYEGEWVGGVWQGFGTWANPLLGRYSGGWKDGVFHGRGVFHWAEEEHGGTEAWKCFDGEFDRGCPCVGVLSMRNGQTFDVAFSGCDSILDNSITPVCKSPFKVAVCVCHGIDVSLLNGTHSVLEDDGRTYAGQWAEGAWHGRGKWKNPSLGEYDGEWRRGMFHGLGTLTWADGKVSREAAIAATGGRSRCTEGLRMVSHGDAGIDGRCCMGALKTAVRCAAGVCCWNSSDTCFSNPHLSTCKPSEVTGSMQNRQVTRSGQVSGILLDVHGSSQHVWYDGRHQAFADLAPVHSQPVKVEDAESWAAVYVESDIQGDAKVPQTIAGRHKCQWDLPAQLSTC